jgi:hypothetical protein
MQRFLGLKFIDKRCYYLIQNGNKKPLYYPTISVLDIAQNVHANIVDEFNSWLTDIKNPRKQEPSFTSNGSMEKRHFPKFSYYNKLDKVLEVRVNQNDEYEYFITSQNKSIPPEWCPMKQTAPAVINELITALKDDLKFHISVEEI